MWSFGWMVLQGKRTPKKKVGNFVRGVLSPVLSNLYLTEVDRMRERAKEVTRTGKYPYIEYARFADDSAPRRREGVLMT
jgi:hypothetical protein